MRKNKMLREKIVLAKAGNEPVEVYRAKARIEGLRKHASQWFDNEDKRYFYWGGDNTARYLQWVERMEKFRKDPYFKDGHRKFWESRFEEVKEAHDKRYLDHLQEYAKAVWMLHKADLEEAKLNLKGE